MTIGRCQLIGSSSMVVQCADLIEEQGGEVVGLISDAPTAQRWAQRHERPWSSFEDDFVSFLRRSPFDLLFSVVNPFVLSRNVLGLPLVDAINFHDGPLPRYAGCNATSWAIFNGESHHAVTWHRMATLVDAGEILRQSDVAISPDETAFTLNLKCYEAGIEAFSLLLGDLAARDASPQPQDLSRRTFHGAGDLPGPPVLSWNMDADHISRLVRALDTGPQLDLGIPRVLTPRGPALRVQTADVSSGASTRDPGTVLATADASCWVATTTHDVLLGGLRDLQGRPVTATDLDARFGIRAATVLEPPSHELVQPDPRPLSPSDDGIDPA